MRSEGITGFWVCAPQQTPGGFPPGAYFQLAAFKGTINRLSGGMLPDGARLMIAHDQVLAPNAEYLKGQMQRFDCGGIHDAAAAGRSPRRQYRPAPNHIIDYVVRHD